MANSCGWVNLCGLEGHEESGKASLPASNAVRANSIGVFVVRDMLLYIGRSDRFEQSRSGTLFPARS